MIKYKTFNSGLAVLLVVSVLLNCNGMMEQK